MILQQIQQELKAPKGQFNKFGGYHYRSCEDIVEALKPILAKHGAAVVLSDDIVEIGGRVYVKATATLKTEKDSISATAYAREPAVKKGMDDSQITGAASSYARKYALNGLFGIDDTKDADSMDNRKAAEVPKPCGSLHTRGRQVCQSDSQAMPDLQDSEPRGRQGVLVEAPQTRVVPAKKAEVNIIQQINTCKSVGELSALFKKLQDESGDAFAEVRGMYQVAFTKRKQEIIQREMSDANH